MAKPDLEQPAFAGDIKIALDPKMKLFFPSAGIDALDDIDPWRDDILLDLFFFGHQIDKMLSYGRFAFLFIGSLANRHNFSSVF